MKRIFILVITNALIWNLFLLDVFHAASIETTGVQTSNSDAKINDYPVPYTNIHKRSSTAFKRLPGWTVYYGKRSYDSSPIDAMDEVRENTEREMNVFNEKTNSKESEENEMGFADLDTHPKMDHEIMNSDIKGNLKRLQNWSTTYGKDDLSEEADFQHGDDTTQTVERQLWPYNIKGDSTSQAVNKIASQSEATYGEQESTDENNENSGNQWGITYGKRLAGWGATYGKRAPGWGATYGKRAPGWGATYGKKTSGWGATYGKRVPGWRATYGKRAPGWSATYGKRDPGWGATYGKRAPGWGATYGKRAPGWGATYGKRAPGWGATYGKRAPAWDATYGKRAPGWGATYGKRAPGWGATYGKRVPGWRATYGKRSKAWNAFNGKRTPGWYATYGKRYMEYKGMEPINLNDANGESQEENMQTLKRTQGWSALYGR
ncbi:hypothetical protein DPMN_015129 [Dreissena polymorpha]|uniref:Uncharacterized protein n=2 Tax=Dreissena polymorpha TaxID=45954 RepID=A0A9D4NAM5_DREPO|nr:hypothetical protein DPMN_015129 [Dreissena polymorpha]